MILRIFPFCLFILIAINLLPGCAAYSPKPLLPADKAALFESRTLGNNIELKKFMEENIRHEIIPYPPKEWGFEMLTLAVFYYSPDMDIARARWGVADAGVKTAGMRPNPSVGFSPQFNPGSSAGVSPWTLGFNLDIPIEVANKRGYRILKAGHLSNATRLNIANTAWKVRSRLRSRLLNLYILEKTETILKRKFSFHEEMLKALEERLKAGEDSQPEVTSSRISLEEARHNLLKTQGDKEEAKVLLADALGLPARALDGIKIMGPFDALPIKLPSPELQRQALLSRSDILSSLEEYNATEAVLQLETARQYPDIHFGPGYSWDRGDNKWSFGINITLPVFNRNEGPIAEAYARRAEAESNFTALQARIIGELNRALSGYRGAIEKLKTKDRLISEGDYHLKEAEALFNSGEEDFLFLTGAKLEAVMFELSRLETYAETQSFLGMLEDAVERPLNPSEPFPSIVKQVSGDNK